MAAVVDEQDVARTGRSDEAGEGGAYVLAGWLSVGVVGVDEDGDVILRETVTVDEAFVHPPNVVDASFELSLGSRIVASDQYRLFAIVSDSLFLSLSLCIL